MHTNHNIGTEFNFSAPKENSFSFFYNYSIQNEFIAEINPEFSISLTIKKIGISETKDSLFRFKAIDNVSENCYDGFFDTETKLGSMTVIKEIIW